VFRPNRISSYTYVRRIVATAFVIGISTAALAACGYKGPLTLPEPQANPTSPISASPTHSASPSA